RGRPLPFHQGWVEDVHRGSAALVERGAENADRGRRLARRARQLALDCFVKLRGEQRRIDAGAVASDVACDAVDDDPRRPHQIDRHHARLHRYPPGCPDDDASVIRACRALEHDAEKWVPVFGKTSCSSNNLRACWRFEEKPSRSRRRRARRYLTQSGPTQTTGGGTTTTGAGAITTGAGGG